MIIYIVLSIALLAFVYIARKPRKVPGRQGTSINDNIRCNTNTNKDELIVASYNVQTGKSLQGRRDITKAASLLQHVDLAGVQEVYAPSWLNKIGIGASQTELLANYGNFAWLFCPTRFRWFRENRGNSILTKLAIKRWQTYTLHDQTNISFRNMTVVKFMWQNQDCYFINTHLHTSIGKSQQLQEVLCEFDKYPRAILVGDFNSTADTPLLSDYLRSNSVVDAISSSNIDNNESERIDWIITRGWKINSGNLIEKGVSDHPYYEINLQLI